jgi:hypothetical protein
VSRFEAGASTLPQGEAIMAKIQLALRPVALPLPGSRWRRRLERATRALALVAGSALVGSLVALLVGVTDPSPEPPSSRVLLGWPGLEVATTPLLAQMAPVQIHIPRSGRKAPPLAALAQTIFRPRCALVGCHGHDGPVAQLDLAAEPAALHDQLVGAGALLAPGRTRVVSRRPEQSFLCEKLAAARPSVGSRMPPPPYAPLGQAEIAAIAAWIDAGAPGGNATGRTVAGRTAPATSKR